ncbi:MAG TPA: serine/threonine protein kinase [Actinobacteria bacterium]|nr:serine/threonine protein kinase [Actinomycetota bacterium]
MEVVLNEELLLERFQILEEVGSGGSARVYKAFDVRMERIVAIKTIPINPQSVPRTMREIQTAALLNHPNIVTLHEFVQDERNYYLIMEYINGVTLSKILRPGMPLSLDQSIAIASQVCIALECAHSNYVIHRDIKPENIMLLRDGRVKVTDFGIAKLLGTSTLTSEGSLMGTIGYISPEQASGEYVDEATDIFATGVVFYQMLAGANPFESDTPAATIFKIINIAPQPASDLNPSVPKKLDSIIAKALNKDPDKRYKTMTQMRYKIERFKHSKARPETTLKSLFTETIDDPDSLDEEFEGEDKLGNLRAGIWNIWKNKQAPISRVSGSLLLTLALWFALHKQVFYPSNLVALLPLIVFIITLLYPLAGLMLLPILITPAIFNFSPALTILFAVASAAYIATFGRHNPLAAMIPFAVPFMAEAHLAPLFPLLAGLFLSAFAAPIVSGIGCLGLIFYALFSNNLGLLLFTTQGSIRLTESLRGCTNPLTAFVDIFRVFAQEPILLLQIVVWAACGLIVGWMARNRRLAGDMLGISLGFLTLFAGYVWLPSFFNQTPLSVEEAMRVFSFSFIIALLLLALIPYEHIRMEQHKSKITPQEAEERD